MTQSKEKTAPVFWRGLPYKALSPVAGPGTRITRDENNISLSHRWNGAGIARAKPEPVGGRRVRHQESNLFANLKELLGLG